MSYHDNETGRVGMMPYPYHGGRRGGRGRNPRGKRRHDEREPRGGADESVDDLVVASMHAAASSWCDAPAADASSDSSSSSSDESEDEEESGSSSSSSDSDENSSSGAEGSDESDDDPPTVAGGDGSGAKEDESHGAASAADNDGKQTAADGASEEMVATSKVTAEPLSAALSALQDYGSDEDSESGSRGDDALDRDGDDASDSDGDDASDIDLVDQLAEMDEREDGELSSNGRKGHGQLKAPRTENEIDPYRCPTEQLEKMNVGGRGDGSAKVLKVDADGLLIVGDDVKKKLTIAGRVRSHIAEQRTVVVDSFIPFALQSQCQNNGNSTLDEGSLLAVVTKQSDDGKITTTLPNEVEGTCSLQVLGKIMEVFGPVQRPLYAIRLPDPPKTTGNKGVDGTTQKHDKTSDSAKVGDDSKQSEASRGEAMEENVGNESNAAAEGNGDEPSVSVDTITRDDEKECAKQTEIIAVAEDDPWSPNGKLSTMLESSPNAAVFSLVDHANMINTDHIIRVSGKGCDASNMHDEELGPSEQQYFSDDEQERQAKRGNRKPRQQGGESRGAISSGGRVGGGGRGRGRGRGYMHANGNSTYPMRQVPHQQPRYQQPQYQHPQYQQPQSARHYPPSFQQQYPNQFTPQQPHYPSGIPPIQQTMYQQQSLYQQQYQPNQHQLMAYHGGQPNQYAYTPQGQAMYGVPPPPPHDAGNAAAQNSHPSHSTPHSQASESDTVYYDYSK
ncbi:hypothetical protein ACHAWF_010248 [Thalassiosira exigua]